MLLLVILISTFSLSASSSSLFPSCLNFLFILEVGDGVGRLDLLQILGVLN